ncbi:hypothetical protein ACSTIS_23765, partial [Vibrio parahaemolyticus]
MKTSIQVDRAAVATSEGRTMKRRTILTGFGGFLLLILVMTIYFFNSFQTVVVSGESMMPTLKSGTR